MNGLENSNNDVENEELDLAREFESLSGRIRKCLFYYNKVQTKELSEVLRAGRVLMSYAVRSFNCVPREFVRENGAAMLQSESPAVLSARLYASLKSADFQLREDESNKDDFTVLASMLDVLASLRLKKA